MRDDLLHAQASVDWAESNLPAFRRKTSDWLKSNIYLTIRTQPPNSPNDVVVAVEKTALPLEFQVEAGAYVNAIRSSLDILACSLASRHCQSLVDETYFPVAASEAAFVSGNYKGNKFVKALPTRERSIIESLKPYKGGNGLLYPLHLLDVVRKHQRLLKAEFQPAHIHVGGSYAVRRAFTPVATGWMRSGPDETVIGLLAKGAPQNPTIEVTSQISLGETAYLSHREVVTALYEFSNLAKAIIRNFDY
jgi:hypothetical protein